jgi:hypothetical protein
MNHPLRRIWLPNLWAYIPIAKATVEQIREACGRYGVAMPRGIG